MFELYSMFNGPVEGISCLKVLWKFFLMSITFVEGILCLQVLRKVFYVWRTSGSFFMSRTFLEGILCLQVLWKLLEDILGLIALWRVFYF